jgi:Tfp pilus assembly protein PilX
MAKLEFALTAATVGVLITLALAALSRLQLLGDAARRVSLASEQSAASAARTALQAAPCAPVSLPTQQPGTAASPPVSPRSCL